MSNAQTDTIAVLGTAVSILTGKDGDYISLTDMLKAKDGEFFILTGGRIALGPTPLSSHCSLITSHSALLPLSPRPPPPFR